MNLCSDVLRHDIGRIRSPRRLSEAVARVEREFPNKVYHSLIKKNSGHFILLSHERPGKSLVECVRKFTGGHAFCAVSKASEAGSLIVSIGIDEDTVLEQWFAGPTNLCLEMMRGADGPILIIDSVFDDEQIAKLNLLPDRVSRVDSATLLSQKVASLSNDIKLPVPLNLKIGVGVALVGIGFVIAQFLLAEKELAKVEAETQDFAAYHSLFSRGSPKAFALQIYRDFAFAEAVPGWKANSLTYDSDTVSIGFEKADPAARLVELTEISGRYGRTISIAGNKASVNSTHTQIPALEEAVVAPIEQIQTLMTRSMDDWMPEVELSFGTPQAKAGFYAVSVEAKLESVFGDDMDTLGTLLNGLPVVVEAGNLTANNDGSWSGKMTFALYGCAMSKCVSQ